MPRAPKPPKNPLKFDTFKAPPSAVYPVPTGKLERVRNLFGPGLYAIKIKLVTDGSESHLDSLNLIGVEDFETMPYVEADVVAEAIMAFCLETSRGADDEQHYRCIFYRYVEDGEPDRKTMDVVIAPDDRFYADEDGNSDVDEDEDRRRVNSGRRLEEFRRQQQQLRGSAVDTRRVPYEARPGFGPSAAATRPGFNPAYGGRHPGMRGTYDAQIEAAEAAVITQMATGFQDVMSAVTTGFRDAFSALVDNVRQKDEAVLEILREVRHEVRTAREEKASALEIVRTTLNNQMTREDNQRQFSDSSWQRYQQGVDMTFESVRSQVAHMQETSDLRLELERLRWQQENKQEPAASPLGPNDVPAAWAGPIQLLKAAGPHVGPALKTIKDLLRPPHVAAAMDTSPIVEDEDEEEEEEDKPSPPDPEPRPRRQEARTETEPNRIRKRSRIDKARERARRVREQAQNESAGEPAREPARRVPEPATPGRKMPGPKQRQRDKEFYDRFIENYPLPPVGVFVETFAEDVADDPSQIQEAPMMLTARMLAANFPPEDRNRIRGLLTATEWEAVQQGLVARSEDEARTAFTVLFESFLADTDRAKKVELAMSDLQGHYLNTIITQLMASNGLSQVDPLIPPHMQRPYEGASRYPRTDRAEAVRPTAPAATAPTQTPAPEATVPTQPPAPDLAPTSPEVEVLEPPSVQVTAPVRLSGMPTPPPPPPDGEDDPIDVDAIPVPTGVAPPEAPATPAGSSKRGTKKRKKR